MNTNLLKRFAQEARKKLIQQVGAKLEWVLQADTPELREKSEQLNALRKSLHQTTKEQLIDTVAYTWFNRLVALRFMDVNGYQPLRVQVLSPVTEYGDAEILQMAKQGNFPEELKLNQQHLLDLLDGRVPSSNPQNEVYRALLIASCNYLHTIFPFLFERIDDYTELLLPDDLISELSIINDFIEGMTEEDCQEVEIMGWLYQFYISERKDEVFAAKGKVEKEDIPAATQLFTPRWIVEYMVQNTLGKLWLQNNPNSSLREKMPYYIETESSQAEEYLKISSPEEITLLDQACGSGHILVYGFDLLYQIYEEAGYTVSQIPKLIIENNLFGYEIDERAAQLASFSVLMKARSYNRRLFRNRIEPNILCFVDLTLNEDEIESAFKALQYTPSDSLEADLKTMQQATNYGSLIQPKTAQEELGSVLKLIAKKQNTDNTQNVFLKRELDQLFVAITQLHQLGKKFHCVVDNPPYMGGGNMNKELSDYVRTNYPDSKADLMACFMEAGLASLQPYGLLGMINQHSWMFLSSYEKLRQKLIDNTQFDTLLHLGPRTFPEIGGEVVQNAAFTFINIQPEKQSSYIRLLDYKDSILKSEKTLEAIQNPNSGWFYTKNQKDFEKIPGNNIGYWISKNALNVYQRNDVLSENFAFKRGIGTGDNERFLRFWSEVNSDLDYWEPYNKGGSFRKWFGNREYKVFWKNDGYSIKNFYSSGSEKLRSRPQNLKYNFIENISYSSLTSGKPSFRIFDGFINDQAGNYFVTINDWKLKTLMAILNSKIGVFFIRLKNQTLNITAEDINSIPIINLNLDKHIEPLIEISRQEWNSRETSWDFEENELIRLNGQDFEEAINLYKAYWTKKFIELHQNEEELNRQFIEIYGLEEDLDPNVPLEDITILRDELNQRELKELSASYQSGWMLNNHQWEMPQQAEYPPLPFDEKELVQQLISYAVGVMFGRYSLDKKGLILANQGETLSDYLKKVDKSKEELSFVPEADNIIPVLDEEWFEDDIVEQFKAIVKVIWGEANYQRNMTYIEDLLQSDIRKYISKDFYKDHIRRYKKRPIYWMFSSPKGAFNVLVYMHRYTADTISNILNNYLREFIGKLELRLEHLEREKDKGSAQEQAKVLREIDKIKKDLLDCQLYEREILFDLATERISIDLDDGVLVNYNKMGEAVVSVAGLNDAAAKKKVRGFDWIDVTEIRG